MNIKKVKGKVKDRPIRSQEGPNVENYFFNLGARWGGWSKPRPDRLTTRERDTVTIV